MAKTANQKKRLLVLQDILRRETDEEHLLSIPQLLLRLESNNIEVERKSLYDDIEALRDAGEDIQLVRGRNGGYYVGQRQFELPELKLLVDAVQSSRFITAKKSAQLIKKLESLTSAAQAMQLQRQVEVKGRVKTMNESIYYTVDAIHTAIYEAKKIGFLYSEWVVDLSAPGGFSKKDRHDGKHYSVSPWALIWMEENYYLVGFEDESRAIRHYRVDKMHQLRVLPEDRDGQKQFEQFDLSGYTKSLFGMFSGTVQEVRMEFEASLVGVVVDRFGKDITLLPAQREGWFGVWLHVIPGPTFFGWVMSFGNKAVLLSPGPVREALEAQMRSLEKVYGG